MSSVKGHQATMIEKPSSLSKAPSPLPQPWFNQLVSQCIQEVDRGCRSFVFDREQLAEVTKARPKLQSEKKDFYYEVWLEPEYE